MPFNSNTNLPNQPVGKISKVVDVFHKRCGDIIEIIKSEVVLFENGLLRKEIRFEILPPLADRRIVKSADQIRECFVCEGAYHYENILICPVCHKTFCHDCKGIITQDEIEIVVCADCEAEDKKGPFKNMTEDFWEL